MSNENKNYEKNLQNINSNDSKSNSVKTSEQVEQNNSNSNNNLNSSNYDDYDLCGSENNKMSKENSDSDKNLVNIIDKLSKSNSEKTMPEVHHNNSYSNIDENSNSNNNLNSNSNNINLNVNISENSNQNSDSDKSIDINMNKYSKSNSVKTLAHVQQNNSNNNIDVNQNSNNDLNSSNNIDINLNISENNDKSLDNIKHNYPKSNSLRTLSTVQQNNSQYSNFLVIIYQIVGITVQLFGEGFVKRNENNNLCKIIINNREEPIKQIHELTSEERNNKTLEVILKNINSITDMSYMFSGCKDLIKLPNISKIDTRNVTNMRSMFEGCINLVEIDLSGLDIENVRSMRGKFYQCENLKSVRGIENWKPEKLQTCYEMFMGCSSLKFEFVSQVLNWENLNPQIVNKAFIGYTYGQKTNYIIHSISQFFNNMISAIND